MIYVAITRHIIRMLWSVTIRFNQLNPLSASTSKIASLPCWLNIELKACAVASHPARWPARSCKLPALSRMFLLKFVITARPRILLITSPIPVGVTPGFLSMVISLHAKKASSDPSFPQYFFKRNFFPLVLLHYKDLYYPQIIMRLECNVTLLHLGFMVLLLSRFQMQFYMPGHRLFYHIHILHIILLGCVVKFIILWSAYLSFNSNTLELTEY